MELKLVGIALCLAVVAGCADSLGGWMCLASGHQVTHQNRVYATAGAAGFMLGVVLLDRIPDLFSTVNAGRFAPWLLMGFLCVFLLEATFASHHRHGSCTLEGDSLGISTVSSIAAQGGLLLHTFFDGVAIGAGFAASASIGTLMFFAVIFHKIPEGFSLASLVLAAGRGSKAALRSSIGLGISTVGGALSAITLSGLQTDAPGVLMALATGSFLYVTTCDLLPAISREKDRLTMLFVTVGLTVYIASSYILHHLGFH